MQQIEALISFWCRPREARRSAEGPPESTQAIHLVKLPTVNGVLKQTSERFQLCCSGNAQKKSRAKAERSRREKKLRPGTILVNTQSADSHS